ncbi:unnamed protein product, partial [Vitis vinifera]
MSRELDSPVQTQMAVAVPNGPCTGEYHVSTRTEGKPAGRRRVFVQTETGCVLGMELDRSDNAHTVKRRLQLALNVPTEESSLTFGDLILNNDLSARSVRVGETGKKVSKIASLQQFIPHDFDAGDHGTSSFPVAAVHRIGILDVRIFNTDRHAGNLLVRKLDGVGTFGQVELIPIDHGLCLPESLEDPYFEWIHWPQASIPFSEDELEYINNLDPARDSEMLRMELPMIREACLRVLVLCTIFLKEAAIFGLCLAEIGEMMSREFRCNYEEPSELEVVCLEARRILADRELSRDYLKKGSSQNGFKGVPGRNPLSRLDECSEEDEIEVDGGLGWDQFQNVAKLSISMKKVGLGERNLWNYGGIPKGARAGGGTSSGNRRSANEQLAATTSFVTLADMSEEEWNLFLERFKELLYPAFANRQSATLRQRQRLGSSCQF